MSYGLCKNWTPILLMMLTTTGFARADDAPQARRYLDGVRGSLRAIEQEMPAITAAAEAAAVRLAETKNLCVRGDLGLERELAGRAGGFAICKRGEAGKGGDVIIYALGVATKENPDLAKLLDEQIADAGALSGEKAIVIGIASHEQLAKLGKLEAAQQACGFLIDNHAPAESDVPTIPLANVVVGWVWTAETFAAFTRNGLTPVVNLHERVDRDETRRKRYAGQKFHGPEMQVKPMPAGVLGKAYLTEAAAVLEKIGTASWPALLATRRQMAGTIRDGGTVYVAAYSHVPPAHFGGTFAGDPGFSSAASTRPEKIPHSGGILAGDPGLFVRLRQGQTLLAEPGAGDFVLAVATDWEPQCERWIEPEKMRRAGRGVAFLVAGFNTRPQDLRRGEILLDHQAPPGDAIVNVPGYDVRIAPVSAVTSETIVWGLTAQLEADRRKK